MLETKAIVLPSGENVGEEQNPIRAISATARSRSASADVCSPAGERATDARNSAVGKRTRLMLRTSGQSRRLRQVPGIMNLGIAGRVTMVAGDEP
jgi:hypothetical protein